MTQPHTPEPWQVHTSPQSPSHWGVTIGDGPTSVTATVALRVDARRIVAAINYCRVFATHELEEMAEHQNHPHTPHDSAVPNTNTPTTDDTE